MGNHRTTLGFYHVTACSLWQALSLRFMGIGLLSLAMVVSSLACSTRTAPPSSAEPTSGGILSEVRGPSQDATPIYHRMALLAGGRPLPFVGKLAFFGTASPDTTLILLGVSLSNQSLTFVREGDRYRAPYEIRIQLRRGEAEIARVEALEFVRVGSFGETSRADESIIFQRYLRVPVGRYDLTLSVKDAGSSRSNSGQADLIVPRLHTGNLSSAIPVYEATGRMKLDSFPSLVANPRSTVVLGRDSTVRLYVEAYGPGDQLSLNGTLRDDRGAVTWTGVAQIPRTGELFSGVIQVPVARTGVGIGTLTLSGTGKEDSTVVPVLITFGDNVPVGSFEDLLGYLRFFASASRLRQLREAPADQRNRLWADFLRSSDPDPSTSQNEALLAYLARLQEANVRFREDGNPGWLTPRGMTYVSFGEPDRTFDQIDNRRVNRVRQQTWEYRTLQFRLVFLDEIGTGRYTFAPGSESRFNLENHKRLAQ